MIIAHPVRCCRCKHLHAEKARVRVFFTVRKDGKNCRWGEAQADFIEVP